MSLLLLALPLLSLVLPLLSPKLPLLSLVLPLLSPKLPLLSLEFSGNLLALRSADCLLPPFIDPRESELDGLVFDWLG